MKLLTPLKVPFVLGSLLLAVACTTSTGDALEEESASASELTAREVATRQQVVRGYYRDIFEREPADAEVAVWEAQANARGYAAVARDLLGSPEGRTVAVRSLYRAYLGRELDAGGAPWVTERGLVAGDPRAVMKGILVSPEYYVRNGNSAAGFIYGLYRDVLGRAASPAEVNSWVPTAVRNRGDVVNGFFSVDEFRVRIVAGWYQRFLKRAPDAPSLVNTVNAIRSGANWRDLEVIFLSSAEYNGLHTCRPTSCAAQHKNCGVIADGCGGTLACGSCGAGAACGVVTPNVCTRTCVPSVTCLDALADCGSIDDGCGHPLFCGTCEDPFTCGGGGLPNVCGGGPIGPIGGGPIGPIGGGPLPTFP